MDEKKGTGRKPLPIDPRVVEALQETYERGRVAEISLTAADATGDITAFVREVRRTGRHAFPDMSIRVRAPKPGARGILAFFMRDKNPRLSRRKQD